jgi:hypothetical protein
VVDGRRVWILASSELEPEGPGPGDGGGSSGYVELHQQVRHVVADRLLGDAQPPTPRASEMKEAVTSTDWRPSAIAARAQPSSSSQKRIFTASVCDRERWYPVVVCLCCSTPNAHPEPDGANR